MDPNVTLPPKSPMSPLEPSSIGVVPSAGCILVAGVFPPPMGGAAKTTLQVYNDLRTRTINVKAVDSSVGGTAHQSSVVYHARRLARAVVNLGAMLFSRQARTCYMFCNAGYGMMYNLPQVFILRLRGTRIFVHHHSYAYIRKKSSLMALLLGIMSPSTVHIFGDRAMADAFYGVYRRRLQVRHISNAATMDVLPEMIPSRPSADGDSPCIGYLSNLCEEKGFDVVVAVFEALAVRSPRYTFALAGGAVTANDEDLLARIKASLGPRLRYHGPVQGAAKIAFYSSIDVFVFPTRFRQEAQPNVIYEALASGVVVAATRRAGIPAMLEGFPARILSEDSGLVPALIAAVEELSAGVDWVARRKLILERFESVRKEATANYQALLNEMLDVIPPYSKK